MPRVAYYLIPLLALRQRLRYRIRLARARIDFRASLRYTARLANVNQRIANVKRQSASRI